MRRYYLTRRIGSGTHADPYTAELRVWLKVQYPGSAHCLQQVIADTLPWALMKYDLDQTMHDAAMAALDLFAFPEGALDRPLSDIPDATRQAIRAKLEAVGFSFAWATLSNTVRDVLEYVAHSVQLSEWGRLPIAAQNFDTRRTVSDVPVAVRQRIASHLTDLGINLSGYTLTTPLTTVIADLQALRFGRARRRWLFHDEEAD